MAFINVWGPKATTSLTCLTRQYKYTYWWYSDDTMEPVEELFDIECDPLELTNLACDPAYACDLTVMRDKYDQEVAAWKEQAVEYNNYTRYGSLFDRTILPEKKMRLKTK